MYDTPLTRPTTVGGLLGNVFRGTGQVAQAGGGVPLQNYLLGPRSLDMLAARRTSTPATTMVAPSPVGLLTPEMISTQAPVGFDYMSPAPQLTKDQETRYRNYLLDSKARDRLPQKTDALDEIERQSTPAPSLFGRIGSGIRSAGKELGGLFEGEEGQLRARELSKALMTGPTRVPVSFGQSLVEGLASGGEAIEARQKEQAMLDMAKAKLEAERAEKQQSKEDKALAARQKAFAVVSGVDDALGILNEYSDNIIGATGLAAIFKNIPTTGANRLNFALDTIKAQLGFAELNAMRQASPTGGALGQVTERELDFLQRTIKALEVELSAEDLEKNLNEVRSVMSAIAHGTDDPRIAKALGHDKLKSDSGAGVKTFNPETGEIELN